MIWSKKQLNNKGMSLVELLIAITILAIITVPLLHAFVSSARINRRAKQTQKLTTMGQDIMEGLKAYTVEDLAYEFDYPTVSSCSAHPSGFQLIKPSLVGTNSSEVASRVKELACTGPNTFIEVDDTTSPKQSISVTGSGPDTKYDFNKEALKGKVFYFAVTNVSAENSTDVSYKADILIKVDPTKYMDPSRGGTVSNDAAKHNDFEVADKEVLADLYSMDTTKDAFFLESGKQMTDAYNALKSAGVSFDRNSDGFEDANAAEYITKTIEVTIDDDSPNKKVTYKFKYSSDGHDVEFPSNPALSTLKYAELENVYLFYMPSYGGTGDTITYKNNTNEKLTFILVKRQITEADNVEIPTGSKYKVDNFATLNSKELTYNCTVNISDSDPTNAKTTLRTNVGTNLAAMIPDPGNTLSSDKILDNTLLSGVNLPTGYKTVAGEKKEDRIFDVTIFIYEEGTIDAALSAKTAIPSDKLLTTVKGNMN